MQLQKSVLDRNCSRSDRSFDSVNVRIFAPVARHGDILRPGVAYYHGGGWVRGMLGLLQGLWRIEYLNTGRAETAICKQMGEAMILRIACL